MSTYYLLLCMDWAYSHKSVKRRDPCSCSKELNNNQVIKNSHKKEETKDDVMG